MSERARYGISVVTAGLAFLLASGCQDDLPTSHDVDPDIVPGFALGPGQSISVVDDLSDDLGTHNVANAINDAKQITGFRSTSTSKFAAYVWAPPGSVTNLGTLSQSPYTAIGNDINNAGQVAGEASNHAARWDPGSSPVQLSEPAGALDALAVAINSQGTVVGTIMQTDGSRPVVWENGGYRFLRLPSPYSGYDVPGFGSDINDREEVVGTASGSFTIPGTEPTAFYYLASMLNGVYVELARLPGTTRNSAKAVNNSGVIVGSSGNRAVRWPDHSQAPEDLGTLGGTWSVANDVNRYGEIVGSSADEPGATLPFRLAPGGYLERLGLPAGASGGVAVGLNDDGHIVGYATFPTGAKHAVVWWRFSGKYAFNVSNQLLSRSVSRTAPGLISLALLSSPALDARAVELRTLNLSRGGPYAGAEVARNADGTLLIQEKDMNGDKLIDLIVSFDGAAALAGPNTRLASTADLLLKGVLIDRSNAIWSSVTVQTTK
jgi:uncharacterized membrane protein